jgi:thioredoxin 1
VSRVARGLGLAVVAAAVMLALAGCGGPGSTSEAEVPVAEPTADTGAGTADITFVEIGSDNYIPCREMRPVMDAIEERYGDRVHVVFVDVYEQGDTAAAYGVRLIPTQVFLDKDGEEIARHEGFFPQEAIEELLAEHGVEPIDP